MIANSVELIIYLRIKVDIVWMLDWLWMFGW